MGMNEIGGVNVGQKSSMDHIMAAYLDWKGRGQLSRFSKSRMLKTGSR